MRNSMPCTPNCFRARAQPIRISPSRGESRRQFHQRITTALKQIVEEHAGKRILVVTHGGVLGVIYRWLNELPIASAQKVEIPNVAYNRVTINDGTWMLDVWADTAHLTFNTFEEA